MNAVETLDVKAAQSLVCQAQRSNIQKSLRPFDDVVKLGETFALSFDDLTFQEHGNDGDRAVVHVSGTLTIFFLGQQESQVVNEEHIVIREHGRWVICDQ